MSNVSNAYRSISSYTTLNTSTEFYSGLLLPQRFSYSGNSGDAVRSNKVDVQQRPRVPQDSIGTNPPAEGARAKAELHKKNKEAKSVEDSRCAGEVVGLEHRQDTAKRAMIQRFPMSNTNKTLKRSENRRFTISNTYTPDAEKRNDRNAFRYRT